MEYLTANPIIGFLFSIAVLVWLVLWIFLPFAVFGIKGKLDGLNNKLALLNENVITMAKIMVEKQAKERR